MPAACGPAFCSTRMSPGCTSSAGSSMRAARSSRPVNTTARPSDSNSAGVAAARLKIAPSGARLPVSATSPPTGETGSSNGRITVRSTQPAGSSSRSASVRPSTSIVSRCSSGLQLAQQRAHAAGGVEVLHVALADRLEVDQHRRLVGDLVEARERDLDAEPAGDRGQVDDGVGRAADRHQHPDRVLDRLLGDDLARRDPLSISRTAALPVSSAATSRSECTAGMAAVPGSDMPERLGDAGHGARPCPSPRRCRR